MGGPGLPGLDGLDGDTGPPGPPVSQTHGVMDQHVVLFYYSSESKFVLRCLLFSL